MLKDMSNSKSETLNPKQAPNTQISNSKCYDLEDRTFGFARDVLYYVNTLAGKPSNLEIGKQLVRSSGSVGANYIEANESLELMKIFGAILEKSRLN
jgi:hypothetical protein